MNSLVIRAMIVSVLGLAGCMDASEEEGASPIATSETSNDVLAQAATPDRTIPAPDGTSGTLPTVTDLGTTGPYTPVPTKNVGPNNQYTTVHPKELGANGVKHPILIWGPGAGAFPEIYATLLLHIASHGFVIVSYNSTPQGPELTKGLDWIIAESKRSSSLYYDKVDTSKVAMGGQSAGSLATFNAAKDERLTTTVHINGGTFPPHTASANLIRPALFICGEKPAGNASSLSATSDIARPFCEIDFKNAKVPVWFGGVNKSGHTTVIDNPLGPPRPANDPLLKPYLAATVGWLRWQIASDASAKSWFVGPSCGFCKQTSAWTVLQKGLE